MTLTEKVACFVFNMETLNSTSTVLPYLKTDCEETWSNLTIYVVYKTEGFYTIRDA